LPTHRALADLVAAYGDGYRELKRARSALDFEDLELRTVAVLSDDGRLRERYSRRFDLIMVDEFQDTNPLQLRILERLARDNILCVGDEFQSIYRFRHADVELFRRRRDELADTGRTRSLSLNFRS